MAFHLVEIDNENYQLRKSRETQLSVLALAHKAEATGLHFPLTFQLALYEHCPHPLHGTEVPPDPRKMVATNDQSRLYQLEQVKGCQMILLAMAVL
jgi:hypothetical protein